MKIKQSTINYIFLVYSMLFYTSFIGFASSFIFAGPAAGNFDEIAAGNPINKLSGVFLLFLAILIIWKSPSIKLYSIFRQSYPWILIIAFISASVLWSEVPSVTFKRVVAFTTLVIVCLVICQLYTAASLLQLLYQLLVGIIVLGFIWHVASGNVISIGISDQKLGMRGIFSDKNAAARVYAYTLIIAVALNKYRPKQQIAALGLILLAIASSQSASAIVTAIGGLGLIIFFRLAKQKTAQLNLLSLVLSLVVICVAGYVISLLYDLILELLGRDPNLTNRAIIWELLMPSLLDKLYFGYGFGAFWASSAVGDFVERWGFIGNAHSGYFEVIFHGGLALSLLLAFMIINYFQRIFRLFLRGKYSHFAGFFLTLLLLQLVLNYVGT